MGSHQLTAQTAQDSGAKKHTGFLQPNGAQGNSNGGSGASPGMSSQQSSCPGSGAEIGLGSGSRPEETMTRFDDDLNLLSIKITPFVQNTKWTWIWLKIPPKRYTWHRNFCPEPRLWHQEPLCCLPGRENHLQYLKEEGIMAAFSFPLLAERRDASQPCAYPEPAELDASYYLP